jgi:hypothetical protein
MVVASDTCKMYPWFFGFWYDIYAWYVRFLSCFILIYGNLQRNPLSLVFDVTVQELIFLCIFVFQRPYGHQIELKFLDRQYFCEISVDEKEDNGRIMGHERGPTAWPPLGMCCGAHLGPQVPFRIGFHAIRWIWTKKQLYIWPHRGVTGN